MYIAVGSSKDLENLLPQSPKTPTNRRKCDNKRGKSVQLGTISQRPRLLCNYYNRDIRNNPFWVPGPTLCKGLPHVKRTKLRDLAGLAMEVHYCQRRLMSMNKHQYIKTAICEKYQTLLEECERALASWNEHRAEIAESRLVCKEAGDDLLRLQAKYARAYTVLQNHAHSCSFCQLVSRLEGSDSSVSSDTISVFDSARYR
jgi:hypothetical protein